MIALKSAQRVVFTLVCVAEVRERCVASRIKRLPRAPKNLVSALHPNDPCPGLPDEIMMPRVCFGAVCP